jgi:SAM-dependent methyltransferase
VQWRSRDIQLEPAVELASDVEMVERGLSPRRRPAILILNHRWQSAMVAPAGEDVAPLLESLRDPVAASDLIEEIGDPDLGERLVSSLERGGHAYLIDTDTPTLEAARAAWWARASRELRVELRADLDASADGTGLAESLAEKIQALAVAPHVVLAARSIAAHADVLSQLAARRRAGRLRFHTLRVRTEDGAVSPALAEALFALQAVVEVEGSPERELPGWAARLVAARVSVMAASRLAIAHLESGAYTEWARRQLLAGLRLTGWAAALGPEARSNGDAVHILGDRLDRLRDEIGWIELDGLARDPVVSGDDLPADHEIGDERVDDPAVAAFRRQHLRRRARDLRGQEGYGVWAQLPDAEEYWVPSDADYVPGHPAEIGLEPGAMVVDVASGYGRVSRRIAPLIAPGGGIVCIEKASIVVDRARRYVVESAGTGNGQADIQTLEGLAERLPLPSDSFDVAIMEWAGQVMRNLAVQAVGEMTRVVRPGGRVVVTYRLAQLVLHDLKRVESHLPDVYSHFQAAFGHADLESVMRRFWGCQDRMSGKPRAWFEERFLPRLLDELRGQSYPDFEETADIYLTVIGRKKREPLSGGPATGP